MYNLNQMRSSSSTSFISSFGSEASSDFLETYLKNRAENKEVQKWRTIEFGTPGTLQYRMLFLDYFGKEISPLHHIPLVATNHGGSNTSLENVHFNFISKTPHGAWVEYEVARNEPFNPFRIKAFKGKPGHYAENMPWNYGILPQTLFKSDPQNTGDSEIGLALEAVEIGSANKQTGEIYAIKVIGAFAVIDIHANLTWKVIVIAADDPMAEKLNSPVDVEVSMPGLLSRMREWLRNCHCVDPSTRVRTYGLNEMAATRESATSIIMEAHSTWKLAHEMEKSGQYPISLRNTLSEFTSSSISGCISEPVQEPTSVSTSGYEEFWKPYTEKLSTEPIPLSDSIFASFRYENAWADLYSPHGSEHPQASSSVQCGCYIFPFLRKKKLNPKTPQQSGELDFEAMKPNAGDSHSSKQKQKSKDASRNHSVDGSRSESTFSSDSNSSTKTSSRRGRIVSLTKLEHLHTAMSEMTIDGPKSETSSERSASRSSLHNPERNPEHNSSDKLCKDSDYPTIDVPERQKQL